MSRLSILGNCWHEKVISVFLFQHPKCHFSALENGHFSQNCQFSSAKNGTSGAETKTKQRPIKGLAARCHRFTLRYPEVSKSDGCCRRGRKPNTNTTMWHNLCSLFGFLYFGFSFPQHCISFLGS